MPPYYPSGSVGLLTSCGAQNFSIGRHWTCNMEIGPCKTFQTVISFRAINYINATTLYHHRFISHSSGDYYLLPTLLIRIGLIKTK